MKTMWPKIEQDLTGSQVLCYHDGQVQEFKKKRSAHTPVQDFYIWLELMRSGPSPSQISYRFFCNITVKPIFYCDVKPLAVGCRIGLDPQHNHLALEIPTCWSSKSLADPTQSLAGPMQSLTDPTRPQCKQVEYSLGRLGSPWVPSRWCSHWPCTFFFFFFFICAG